MILARARISYHQRGRIDPSDVVQETLCLAIQRRNELDGLSQAGAMRWLRRKLRDQLVDRFRRLRLEPINASLLGDDSMDKSTHGMSAIPCSQPGPDARLIREEDALLVAKMLGKLSEAQAEAIVLKHCEGMPVMEIARHMNKSPEAIGGHLRHGLCRLRKQMTRED
jgi:RNA polymerase sigma factor (sigma-70 family)